MPDVQVLEGRFCSVPLLTQSCFRWTTPFSNSETLPTVFPGGLKYANFRLSKNQYYKAIFFKLSIVWWEDRLDPFYVLSVFPLPFLAEGCGTTLLCNW